VHLSIERCRQVAERWGSSPRDEVVTVQATIEVKAPGTGACIGSIVLLSKPAGYSKVFRHEERPALAATVESISRFGEFASRDPQTRRMLDDLKRIATADVNLLIIGETGTGKELLARHVHACSRRRHQPYLAVNCGAIGEHLMESTFFGYVKGAFSGADPRGRAGYFESAQGGTLFLDEIGELPPAMQAALLRVLEDGSFQRVGSCETRLASCRVVAATHRDLEDLIAQGRFRQDLYFRLKVVQRTIKPLRERPCDIKLLAEQFAETMRRKHGLESVDITPDAYAALSRYHWPGNARELRNAIEVAVLCADGTIDIDCLPPEVLRDSSADVDTKPATAASDESLASLRDYERQIIVGMLRKYRKVNKVAHVLGLARSTLYRKFAELNIDQSEFIGSTTDVDAKDGRC